MLNLFEIFVSMLAMFMLGMGTGVQLMKPRYHRVISLYEREKKRCERIRRLTGFSEV